MKILVTGVTGYIGGRLVPELLKAGHQVRVFTRNANRLKRRKWFKQVEVAVGDMADAAAIALALQDIEVAYYLVHSMYEGDGFAEKEEQITRNFTEAARNVKLVIYLGGLSSEDSSSEHLTSRANVGRVLRESCPVTEFRAGPIIGSGSASFEIIRYLVERLPIMLVPTYLQNKVQTVAVDDVLQYLVSAINKEPLGIIDIGSDPLPYTELLAIYAAVRGLKRTIIKMPFIPLRVAGGWMGLITPVPTSLTMPLVKGILHPVIGKALQARQHFPEIRPRAYKEAVQNALLEINNQNVVSRWLAPVKRSDLEETYDVIAKEGIVKEVRTVSTDASPEALFRAFTRLGGDQGWLSLNWAWRLRGWLDSLVGGPGLKRGRRNPDDIEEGDSLDFWRVEKIEEPHLLRLKAEMKMPGKAWLQWETKRDGNQTFLTQTAIFIPKGLWGTLYWYSLFPVHWVLFGDMCNKIVSLAKALEKDSP